jgi:hypothetical protein
MINVCLEYIHENPVKKEIVFHPFEYKFSYAIDYARGIVVIYIDKIECFSVWHTLYKSTRDEAVLTLVNTPYTSARRRIRVLN